MKYDVKMSCGHTETIQIYGTEKNVIRKSTGMNNTVPVKNAEIRKSRNGLKKKDCRHLREPKDR